MTSNVTSDVTSDVAKCVLLFVKAMLMQALPALQNLQTEPHTSAERHWPDTRTEHKAKCTDAMYQDRMCTTAK